jgi:hypothetical protein
MDNGGAGGQGAECVASLVAAAAGEGLSASDVVTDPEVLVGTTFTVPNLCPDHDRYGLDFDGPHNFHVQRSASGGLEVVSSVPGDVTFVEVKALQPSGLGFDLADVLTCTWLSSFEEEYTRHFYSAATVHLVFAREPGAPQPTRLVAAASTDDEPVVVSGGLDETPPAVMDVDMDFSEGLPESDAVNVYYRSFEFSEPIKGQPEVVARNADGVTAEVGTHSDAGYVTGFWIGGMLPSGFNLEATVEDLAGNSVEIVMPVPGIDVPPLVGDFEGDDRVVTSWDLTEDHNVCWEDVSGIGTNAAEVDESMPAVPAITGARSFLDDCGNHFRLTRAPGATTLKVDVRLLQASSWTESVSATVWVLAPGGEVTRETVTPTWTEDATYPGVSDEATVSFSLPETGDDLLVSFSTTTYGPIWLDSLRTE